MLASELEGLLNPVIGSSIRDKGAVPGDTGDQTAAIQAVDAELGAAGGGNLLIPRGVYRCLGALTYSPGVNWVFEGGAQLHFPTDLGSGVRALSPSADALFLNDNEIVNPQLRGPATSPVLGVAGCAMDGLLLNRRTAVRRPLIRLFRSGVVFGADHSSIEGGRVTNNYYNVYFGPGASTFGDQTFSVIDLTGGTMASIACATDNGMDGVALDANVHLGFSPYGIMRETGTATRAFINNSVFNDVAFEACGNAAIYAPNAGDTIGGLSWTGGGIITLSPTYKIPSVPVRNGIINCPKISRSSFAVGGHYGLFDDVGATGYIEATGPGIDSCTFYNMGIVSGFTTATPFLTPATGNSLNTRYEGDGTRGIIIWTSTAVAAGDVMEVVSDSIVRKATAGGTVTGVAESPASASNYLAVAKSGMVSTQITGTVAAGTPLIHDTASPGKLKAATGVAGEYVVAVAVFAGTNTKVLCEWRVGGA